MIFANSGSVLSVGSLAFATGFPRRSSVRAIARTVVRFIIVAPVFAVANAKGGSRNELNCASHPETAEECHRSALLRKCLNAQAPSSPLQLSAPQLYHLDVSL